MSEPHFNWRKLRDPNQERGDNRAWRAQLTQLVIDDEKVREDGRRCCTTNLLALAYVLGYCLITEDVHHEALHFFPHIEPDRTVEELHLGVKRRRTLLYPRNTYKSTLDMCYIVQTILRFYMTIAILIMSGGKELAFDFVEQIASFFIKPLHRPATLFQALFPELCCSKNPAKNPGEFTCPLRQHEPKIVEPLIWANSIESSTTGYHPDLLIYDDIHNNRNSRTFEGRTRVAKAYKLTRKILKPTGIELFIGTPYGLGDVFSDQVLTARPGTYERVFKPAMKLLSGERLDPNGFPAENEVELLFPSILNYDFLREEYDTDYEFFMSQYMLDSYGAAELVFTEAQMLAAIIDEDVMPMEGQRYIHFRLPCRSLDWHATSGAVGIMRQNRMYITETIHGHYKPSVLAKLIHDVARRNGAHHVNIEESPGARMIQPAINNHSLTTGWDISITWTEFESDAAERDTRIRNLEPLLATSRLYFSNALKTKPLIEGFVQYGMTKESGLPDVISRVADNLPLSIAATELEDEDLAWEMMRERDKFNIIYNRGQYAPSEPEPEEIMFDEPRIEDQRINAQGLEVMMPGLE
jgi:hypothetical protein